MKTVACIRWMARVLLPAAVLAGAARCGGSEAVQDRAEERRPPPADTLTGFPPTLSIDVDVAIKELVHHVDPDISVRFLGNASDTLSRSERVNLPDTVRPGVLYRDVRIRYELRIAFDSLFYDIDRVLRQGGREGGRDSLRPPVPHPDGGGR